MTRLRGATAMLMLGLAACAAQPVREAPRPAATAIQLQSQTQRTAVLVAHPRWALHGRVALANGRQGGSGRIDWVQDGADYAVSLSAPITRQSWRLSGDARSVRLEGLEGGPRQGTDAEVLLRDTTGWVIPVAALGAWVRGLAAPGLPPPQLQFDAGGRLARLQQGDWTIDYSDWQPQPGLGVELPHRLNATRGDARVRLIVDAWQDGSAAAP